MEERVEEGLLRVSVANTPGHEIEYCCCRKKYLSKSGEIDRVSAKLRLRTAVNGGRKAHLHL